MPGLPGPTSCCSLKFLSQLPSMCLSSLASIAPLAMSLTTGNFQAPLSYSMHTATCQHADRSLQLLETTCTAMKPKNADALALVQTPAPMLRLQLPTVLLPYLWCLLCALQQFSLNVKGPLSTSAPESMLPLCQGQANMRASIRSSVMISATHLNLPAAFAVPFRRCCTKPVKLSGRQGSSLDINNVPAIGTSDPVWQSVLQRAAFQLGTKTQEVSSALLGQ